MLLDHQKIANLYTFHVISLSYLHWSTFDGAEDVASDYCYTYLLFN